MKLNELKRLVTSLSDAADSLRWRRLMALVLVLSALLLSACENSDSQSETTGEVVIGLTDADGDFISYTVDVKSLTLTRKDGVVVNVLPLATQVDFAQYTELTEFFTAQTIPSGRYVKGTMLLDYANADIQVELNNESVKATLLDAEGNELTGELEVEVKLDNLNAPLLIAPGVPAHITLDFDLETSNIVNIDVSPITVTVEPVLVADVVLEAPKAHRVRGPLKSVDQENGTFKVMLRPFRHLISKRNETPNKNFGVLTVTGNDETAYEINGRTYTGNDGIIALGAIQAGSGVVAFGEIKFNPRRFVATDVRAGSSVPGSDNDVVKGHVVAREGNVLTIRGAVLSRDARQALYGQNIEVRIGEATSVVKQAYRDDNLDISAVSVGQQVVISGELMASTEDMLTLDATAGLIRMNLTNLRGTVNRAETNLEMTLQTVDSRAITLFNFAGTGQAPESDANPRNYEVGIGGMDASAYQENGPVIVRGHANTFAQAPVDFEAQALIDVSARAASMSVGWKPATTSPFTDMSARRLILDLEGVGRAHHVKQAGVLIDLTELTDGFAATIQANDTGKGLFAIKERRSVQIYTTFESFESGLVERLNRGQAVRVLNAKGKYNIETATLVARKVTVVMQ